MPKIQGKQIAPDTILQDHLELTTPVLTDTLSAVTVEYVTDAISAVTSTSGIIGTPDDGTYTDGIFTTWESGTTVANMADDVNEMLLLLAPAPPITNWNNVFSNLTLTNNKYTGMKITGSGSDANSPVVVTTTPIMSVSVISLLTSNARSRDGGVFTVSDNGGQIATETLTTSSTTKSSGTIRYTIVDPYDGVAGKAGFYSGVTAFTLNGTTNTLTTNTTIKTLTFAHPGTDTDETYSFYVDSTLETPITVINSQTKPSLVGYVSGVPTFTSAQSITNINISIDGINYFYNPTIYYISGNYVDNTNWTAPTTPPTAGVTYTETSGTVPISDNVFNDTEFSYTAYGRNIAGTSDASPYVTWTDRRIDTKSVETSRKLSGTGLYPITALSDYYYGTWSSSSTLLSGDYLNELMLKEGKYQWPGSINYSAYGGPDYSSVTTGDTGASNYRWACFDLGTVTNATNFTFTINGSESFGSTVIISDIQLFVRVVGATGTVWCDANAAWAGGNPTIDGDDMLVFAESTVTSRKVTFGTVPRTGTVYVRIGLAPSSSKKFTSIS